MPAKNKTTKGAKTTKTAKVTPQLPAAQLPAAQLPAAQTAKVKEQPMWNGKPISAAGLTYHQRVEAHVCVKCGGKLAEGSNLLCEKHLKYHNDWHAARNAKIAKAMELLKQQDAPVAQAAVVAAVEAAPTAKAKKPARKTSKK